MHARSHPDALIDVRLFGRRTVGAAALTTFLFGTAFFGTALLLPMYFMTVRQESAFDTGLLIAVQGFGAMLAMPFSSRMTDKTGAGGVVLVGLTLVAMAMLGLSLIASTTPLWCIEMMLLISGLGMGSTMMPAMSAALSALQRHEISRATSGLIVLQRVGGSIGTALLAVILTHQMSHMVPVDEAGKGAFRAIVSAHPIGGTGLSPDIGLAFGHTFMWSFRIIMIALCAATLLPRNPAKADRRDRVTSAIIE